MKKRCTILALASLFCMSNLFAQDYYEEDKKMDVYKTNQAMTIDGIENESVWASVSEQKLELVLRDIGADPVANSWGYGATFKALYDDDYLYLFVKVTDNDYVPYDADKMSGETNVDNVEMYFHPASDRDPVDDSAPGTMKSMDSQLRMSAGNTENRATGVGYAISLATLNKITGFTYATALTTDGYNMEVKLGWDIPIPDAYMMDAANYLSVVEGGSIRFDLNAANCTSYSSGRVIMLGWSGEDVHAWHRNSKYGLMTFRGEPSGIKSVVGASVEYAFNNDLLTLQNADNAQVDIYDISGRTVNSGIYTDAIDFSAYVSGIYIVNVSGVGSFKIAK